MLHVIVPVVSYIRDKPTQVTQINEQCYVNSLLKSDLSQSVGLM